MSISEMDSRPVVGPTLKIAENPVPAFPSLLWRGRVLQTRACRLALFFLPLALALGWYYRPVWQRGLDSLPLSGDACFYAYQLRRVAELGGRWWKLATDDQLGRPYATLAAKNPGLFEGVDLLLVSTLTSQLLPPAVNYHAMVLLVLAFNGWVTAWLVRRFTRSYFWAAVAVVLVTLNMSTACRLGAHLNLFKHGWVLLAVWAFFRCLEAPSIRRGFTLGFFLAMVLQGSFYYGFFLTLALSVYGLGCLLWKRLTWQHGVCAVAAWLIYAVAGAGLTFPVWTKTRHTPLADMYFHRYQSETGTFAAELWQYIVSPHWKFPNYDGKSQLPVGEGWHYPGYLVLLALLGYVLARLVGRSPAGWAAPAAKGESAASTVRFLDMLLGLAGVLVLISLKHGPMPMIYTWVGCFRCYGRGGLVAVGLWSVAAPLILWLLAGKIRGRRLRVAVLAGVAGLAWYDAYRGQQAFYYAPNPPTPAWVAWLAEQPAGVRLAAFSDWNGRPGSDQDGWSWESLYYRFLHHHPTLNGCEAGLLDADLRLLGASYENMNPAGLRFIVSLGYETLAFHEGYLRSHPSIAMLPHFQHLASREGWEIYRAGARAGRYPRVALPGLLAQQQLPAAPEKVPAACWITEQLDIDQTVVTGNQAPVRLAWADAAGKRVSQPVRALFQHVFGPGLPAYAMQTPASPGSYRLLFLDEQDRPITAKPFEVVANLMTARRALGDRTTFLHFRLDATTGGAPGRRHVVLENPTPFYLQALGDRPQGQHSIRTHPGMFDGWTPWACAVTLVVWDHSIRDGQPARETRLLLPHDVPPYGRLAFDLPGALFPHTRRGLQRLGHSPGRSAGSPDQTRITPGMVDVRVDIVPSPVFSP